MRQTFWIIFSFLLIGCSTTQSPTPTIPIPTNTAQPTPTSEPSPTNTPELVPTKTTIPPIVPTATETPRPTLTPKPTRTPTPVVDRFPVEGRFTIYGKNPAVPNDNIGPNGKQFTDPGGVIFHDGKFHMFHNAFTGWPAPVDVMYSTSADGINWELAQDEPVMKKDAVPYAGVAFLASSVIVRDDGTWVMYFYTWEERSWPVASSSIGLATAPGPFGPWTPAEELILTPGSEGEWDDLAVRTPSVIRTDNGYEMYYGGYQRAKSSIGLATSADGLNWTKHNNQTTASAPFAESDPVFSGSGADWDAKHVYQPRVRATEDGLMMLYTASFSISTNNSLVQKHGLAFSKNSKDWIRSSTPIFEAEEVHPKGQNIWYTELEYALDRFFIYLELGNGSKTEIYVAEFDKSMLPD